CQLPGGTRRELYYSADWQVLEERVDGATRANAQYVWSPVAADTLVLRDRDANGLPGDGPGGLGLEERLYVQQDAQGDVTALVDAAGAGQGRYVDGPLCPAAVLGAAWG